MKKILIAIAAVLVSVASFAQGTVAFNTRISGVLDAPVERGSGALGTNPGVGDLYTGELVIVGAGGALTAVPDSRTPFRSVPAGGSALLAKYVVSKEVVLPVAAGPVTLRFRAFLTSAGSYDAADQFSRGSSTDFTIPTLGSPPGAPPNLVGITGFVIPVPEPSTIALGALGAAALLFRRRK